MSKHEKKLIEVRNLKKHFEIKGKSFSRKTLKAVDGVSFAISKGETLGLVGESGCGKTTVGRTILHLYKPTSGEIIYRGRKIDTPDAVKDFRRASSCVFQDPYSSLNPKMTVADIIAEPIDIQFPNISAAERLERIISLMAEVGLGNEHASRYAHEFSGGQRQRIGIARALAVNPEFIVCDEPVSALDVSIQAQIVNMFTDLRENLGLTYLFIAHDLLIVRHISDKIAGMYLGKIVELASSDSICHSPMHPYTKLLMSAIPLPDPKSARKHTQASVNIELPSPINIPSGCAFRTRCPYAKEICTEEVPLFREIEKKHFIACHFAEIINF